MNIVYKNKRNTYMRDTGNISALNPHLTILKDQRKVKLGKKRSDIIFG
jgi:hypothetical protein